ncbi:hypothetical protein ACTFIZ_002349 [Dictyostelium cf. discoideum]
MSQTRNQDSLAAITKLFFSSTHPDLTISSLSRVAEVSRSSLYYNYESSWGGARNYKFSEETEQDIHELIYMWIQMDKELSLVNISKKIKEQLNIDVNSMYLSRLLKNWGYSYRYPTYTEKLKYTPENIYHMRDFIRMMAHLNPLKVKFVDESHYSPVHVRRKKCFLPIGSKEPIVSNLPISKTYSTIVLTSIEPDQAPIHWDIIEDTNDADNFDKYIARCIAHGILRNGDFLILDNARVHNPATLYALCGQNNIIIRFQPKYSPEFNATEHVHQLVKSLIRGGHLSGTFLEKIQNGHEQVSKYDVKSFYRKSIKFLTPII